MLVCYPIAKAVVPQHLPDTCQECLKALDPISGGVACDQGCGAVYCAERCRVRDKEHAPECAMIRQGLFPKEAWTARLLARILATRASAAPEEAHAQELWGLQPRPETAEWETTSKELRRWR